MTKTPRHDTDTQTPRHAPYRDAVVHDGGVLVGHVELVDDGGGVLVEEDPEVGGHVVQQDTDVVVTVRQLVLVDQAHRVTYLVQVQAFLWV